MKNWKAFSPKQQEVAIRIHGHLMTMSDMMNTSQTHTQESEKPTFNQLVQWVVSEDASLSVEMQRATQDDPLLQKQLHWILDQTARYTMQNLAAAASDGNAMDYQRHGYRIRVVPSTAMPGFLFVQIFWPQPMVKEQPHTMVVLGRKNGMVKQSLPDAVDGVIQWIEPQQSALIRILSEEGPRDVYFL
ncbi:hypothetical protein Mmc1_2005 [Magnetococcus marinus MC-1]|uniref:Uncharacterized protein n=1 Tax=Magnetococcus marinus (strain ATCC BAA-1437 / JCM 17883 / MC-1) TaxID=156889 RepID=A0L963_MAGMM|nr:hypothetical protein [Magnetococcus marinus]ABK44506.1 hypothetical protein Mmc1_2005 [Magnetococcus marinus MC-1]